MNIGIFIHDTCLRGKKIAYIIFYPSAFQCYKTPIGFWTWYFLTKETPPSIFFHSAICSAFIRSPPLFIIVFCTWPVRGGWTKEVKWCVLGSNWLDGWHQKNKKSFFFFSIFRHQEINHKMNLWEKLRERERETMQERSVIVSGRAGNNILRKSGLSRNKKTSPCWLMRKIYPRNGMNIDMQIWHGSLRRATCEVEVFFRFGVI